MLTWTNSTTRVTNVGYITVVFMLGLLLGGQMWLITIRLYQMITNKCLVMFEHLQGKLLCVHFCELFQLTWFPYIYFYYEFRELGIMGICKSF